MGHNPAVLVTGAGGQVGKALRRYIPQGRFLTHQELEITNPMRVREAAIGMRVIVHLAAMTNVDACEEHPERAMEVNGKGTANVCEAATEIGARVIYLSTDYVFDGTKIGEYEVDDLPNPINAYGQSKHRGELYVEQTPGAAIVRTSWVLGAGKNFVRTIVGAAHRLGSLRVVDDQRGRPTIAMDLAESIWRLVSWEADGIIHISGAGPICSWAELAIEALEQAGVKAEVERVDSKTYEENLERRIAPRPRNSALSLTRAHELGLPLKDWRVSLKEHFEEVT